MLKKSRILEMPRPVWLRSTTWQFTITRLLEQNAREQRRLARLLHLASPWLGLRHSDRFGALFCVLGGLSRPRLLYNTVILLDDGAEYLITPTAAARLAGRRSVTIYRLADGRETRVAPAVVKRALKTGSLFDQLDGLIATRLGESATPTA